MNTEREFVITLAPVLPVLGVFVLGHGQCGVMCEY